MIDFLLEVGFEEFPSSLLKKTALNVSTQVEHVLKDKRIFYRSTRTIYTPRRFGILVLGLERKQKPQITQIQGPPKKLAYDKHGKPTEKLAGFMKAHNLKRAEITVIRTKKGEYICGKREVAGTSTEEILYNEIPKMLNGLEFPKTMVWDDKRKRFPRPIRWLVALLDRKPLRFEFAGVKADRYSMPNQHFSFKQIRLEKPREYLNFLRHGGVVVDPNERRKLIIKRIKQVAQQSKAKPVYDEAMIDELNCTTEYPEAVTGEFSEQYCALPEEFLMAVLKSHGNLIWLKDTNKFICVFSAKKKALPNVRKGYTRVIEARLYDALFYYKNDLEQGLEQMLEQTKTMVWLKDLGTIYDKAERLSHLVEQFNLIPDVDMVALKRAALLCKADLFSQMVRDMEFTSLQGITGAYYAKAKNESDAVVMAIKEHYLPRFVGDELPKTKEGAVLSICDKIDNIVGGFFSGQRPTSSYDPLGLRRTGYAVINLLDANDIHISLLQLIEKTVNNHSGTVKKHLPKGDDVNEGSNTVDVIHHNFFRERLTRYLQDRGFRYDEINAVLANWKDNDDVVDLRMRCEALKSFRNKQEFTKLVIGQKRVRNIIKGAIDLGEVDATFFKDAAEKTLYQKGTEVTMKLKELLSSHNYQDILNLLLAMRTDIDKFFDDVLVMCDDEKLKHNRLALVNFINQIFMKFVDFSQIVIEGEKAQE
jgi:glycyl-tRNA synthetase beta chain